MNRPKRHWLITHRDREAFLIVLSFLFHRPRRPAEDPVQLRDDGWPLLQGDE